MDDDKYWFIPRRYGCGAIPVTWQGWALIIGFIAMGLAVTFHWHGRHYIEAAILVPATILLLVVIAKTTRGGWRWRWGEDD